MTEGLPGLTSRTLGLPAPEGSSRGSRALRLTVYGALGLAATYFAWRGVWRAITDSGDLAVGYSAARAWLVGQNPYDSAALKTAFLAGGAEMAASSLFERLLNVYFPTTIPVFLPIAFVSWPAARLLALALNVAVTVFIGLGLVNLLGLRFSALRALGLIAFILALAPVHTTVASGQTGSVAVAAVVAALLAGRSASRISAGVLYGLATAVKVQIGLPFLAYSLWRRQWRTAAVAGLVLASLTLSAIARMEAAAVPWLRSWLANMSALSGPGGINDPTPQNPDSYSLINLQYPLAMLIQGRMRVEFVAFGVVGAAALAFVLLVRGRRRFPELLALAVVAVLGLLVTYHRYYDAVLLALPIAWALSTAEVATSRLGLAVLILCADFLLPAQTALHSLQERQVLPPWLTRNALWGPVLLAQHSWALVLLAVVLVAAAAHERHRESCAPSGPGHSLDPG